MTDPAPEEFKDNGCGPKKFGWVVPEYRFNACCRQHDWGYQLGGTEEDRARVDREFLECMRHKADEFPWYRRWAIKAAAWVYYQAVRVGGAGAFTYREARHADQV